MADVIVGRFALIDLIAKGGSGAVWRAWDQKTQKVCAAKVLRQRDSADLMRFVREKGVTFDHPHLLTPYGWGAEDEHVVIAMPLVSGGTLESAVRVKGPLAEPAVVVILDQLLDGLAHVHQGGWIHRDVKPANIMFEPRGAAWPHSRLADFGIAVHESDVRFTHVGMVNGTPGYMAPELFSMADPVPSHDVYAAGVVALVALNGPIKLRDGAFRPEELNRLLNGVTPKLAAVIRRMVAAQPEDRYRDAASVRQDLPRVPPGYRLTHKDGTPLSFPDTLSPLPANAPGVKRPEQPAPARSGPSMEEIRSGAVKQAFTTPSGPSVPSASRAGAAASASVPSASPQTGPRWNPSAPSASIAPTASAPPGASGTALTEPLTGHPTSPNTSPGSTAPKKSRATMIAVIVGIAAALVLGLIVMVSLLAMFPPGANSETGKKAYGEVTVDQSCSKSELGTIGVTEDGKYLSCRPGTGDEAKTFTYR